MIRLLVTGGRDFTDQFRLNAALDYLHERCGVAAVCHGGARGADTCADEWAQRNRVFKVSYPVTPADWDQHGKAAGILRNQAMLEEFKPTCVVAFPGGRGTADMVRRAEAAGLVVWKPYG